MVAWILVWLENLVPGPKITESSSKIQKEEEGLSLQTQDTIRLDTLLRTSSFPDFVTGFQ